MHTEIGRIEAIYRYPVKSMRGQRLESATLGWHGLEGDRRFAFGRSADRSGFPWVTASKVPRLVLFTPIAGDDETVSEVVSPGGEKMALAGKVLAGDIGSAFNAPVELMRLRQGIFDDATISLISADTVREIGRLSGTSSDVRRFRPNIVVRTTQGKPFEEDEWLGAQLILGEGVTAPIVSVTARDVRCAMINIDPDAGTINPGVLKAVVRANQTCAGAYATVTRCGPVQVGQPVTLRRQP